MKLISLVACALASASPALAAPYTFTALPFNFDATALNDVGQIVGSAPPPAGYNPTLSPIALYSGGVVTTLSLLITRGKYGIALTGINNAGDLLGNVLSTYPGGFEVVGGVPVSLSVARAAVTGYKANALNNNGQVVGFAQFDNPDGLPGLYHGFLTSGSSYQILTAPGSFQTDAIGLNDYGKVVGSFINVNKQYIREGFEFSNGTYTTLLGPGGAEVSPIGIDNAGEIAGTISNAAGTYGFVELNGVFTNLVAPDGTAFLPVGLNNNGQLLGGSSITGTQYLATPQAVPEPETAALMVFEIVGMGALRLCSRVVLGKLR